MMVLLFVIINSKDAKIIVLKVLLTNELLKLINYVFLIHLCSPFSCFFYLERK